MSLLSARQVSDQYLVEFNDARNQVLTEGVERRYIIEGIFIQAGVINNNRRFYIPEAIEPGINKYIEEKVLKNRAVGELNHPVPPTPYLNYKNVSHKIESLVRDGNNWLGRAVVTKNTPSGAVIAGLMDEGVIMATSSRATGDTRKRRDGILEVVGNYKVATAGDIVSDPSAPDAFLTNLMEGKEWAWANGALVPLEESIRGDVDRAARTGLTPEKMDHLYRHILSKLQGA